MAGVSSAYSADLTVVKSTGSSLNATKTTIEENKACSDVSGVGDSTEITDAIADYKDKWENALTRLGNAIGSLGDRVTEAAHTYETHDQDWSRIWGQRQGGQQPAKK